MTSQLDYFITGACGMVGSHIMDRLSVQDASYRGTLYNPQVDLGPDPKNYIPCDVRDVPELTGLIGKFRPRTIFHLAAQSYPTLSWEKPQETIDINAIGTVNLFEAIKQARRQHESYDPMVVVACSSAQYGASMTEDRVPLPEDTPLQPLHPYGVSKVAQDMLAFQYFYCDRIRTIRARIFNTTGPRKKNDVVSDWARRVVQIERGQERVLRVGNLDVRRAIMDVSDLVEALFLLSEKGQPGEVYNICYDRLTGMRDLLGIFKKLSRVPFEHEVDSALLRASDEPVIYGDSSRLNRQTGWRPRTVLEETVKRVLDYERGRNH